MVSTASAAWFWSEARSRTDPIAKTRAETRAKSPNVTRQAYPLSSYACDWSVRGQRISFDVEDDQVSRPLVRRAESERMSSPTRRVRDINSTEAGRLSWAVMPETTRYKHQEGQHVCKR